MSGNLKPGDLLLTRMGDRGEPIHIPMFPWGSGAPTTNVPSGTPCLVLEVRPNSYDRRSPGLTILCGGSMLETNAIYMESAE